uniref:Putative secreted protein n=1 Tax=Anopheles triannulatus TaxID=58253 RepID=A0A2M4B0K2_9DIPT
MNLLPSVLIAQVTFHIVRFLVLAVARVVLTQSAHQDHRNKPDQEDHHHEAVENAEPVDAVLEKVRIQVLIEAILELDRARLPVHLVRELDLRPNVQQLLALGRERHVHDLFAVVADVELFVRVDVVLLFLLLTDDTPDGQIVDIHLIPVLVLHRVHKRLVLLLGQLHHTDLRRADIIFENQLVPTKLQLHSLERFAHRFMVMIDRLFGTNAERQREVGIRFLPVVVRSDRVHPQHNLLVVFVNVIVLIGNRTGDEAHKYGADGGD